MKRGTSLVLAAVLLAVAAIAFVLWQPGTGPRRKGAPPAVAANPVIETKWTKEAAKRASKGPYFLPQLKVYDSRGRLIYILRTGLPDDLIGKVGAELDRAIAAGRPIPGPSFEQTLADLATADGRPAAASITGRGRITLVDYWASWCVPCKVLEKELYRWAGRRPPGSIQIVRAETDPAPGFRKSAPVKIEANSMREALRKAGLKEERIKEIVRASRAGKGETGNDTQAR